MKILFLDVDGVLNKLGQTEETRTKERSKRGFIGMEPALCAKVRRIIDETGCEVVLSSSWRDGGGESTQEVAEALELERFYGETGHDFDGFRGAQILKYLADQHEMECLNWKGMRVGERIEKYAILDDEGDMFAFQPLFQTSYEEGITDKLAEDIIHYFNS